MDSGVNGFTGLEIFFLVCAGIGGVLFAIRLVIQLAGFGHDVGAGVEVDHGDIAHADSDAGFKILTLQGITAFFMMFGLVGFALYSKSGLGVLLSMAGALGAGLATVWIMGRLFASAKKLQSSGTVDVMSAIGGEGTVYLTIPQNGTGRVQVIFRNHHREFDAVSQSKEEIKTGEQIKVVWVNGNVLVVEKIQRP